MRYGNRGLMTDGRNVKKRYIIEGKVDQDYTANFDWFSLFVYWKLQSEKGTFVGLLK